MIDHNSISGKCAFVVLILCAVFLTVAVVLSGMQLNHDCALLLQCGRLITEGSIPYIDHIETNIHMAQYIHVPPVLLSRLLNIDVALVFFLGVLFFSFYSCWTVYLVIRKSGILHSRAGMLLVASAVLVFSMQIFRIGDFGQREHLFVLACLPFVLLRLSRYNDCEVNKSVAVIIGIFAGLMMLCKPTFFLIIVLIEVWMRLRYGKNRSHGKPEILAVYSILFLFAVHLLLFAGSIHSPFFTRWLPYIAKHYSSYDAAISEMIRWHLKWWFVMLTGIVAGLFLKSRVGPALRRLFELLILAVILGIMSFFIQHKGWTYQLIPAFGFSIVLWTTVAAVFEENHGQTGTIGKMLGNALLFSPCIICLLLAGSSFRFADTQYTEMNEYIELINSHSSEGDRISFISTDVYPMYPTLVYADRLPGTRFMSAFPIALAYSDETADDSSVFPYRPPDEQTSEERLFLAELGSDILENRPVLVFIMSTDDCQACPTGFRIEEYLTHSGWIAKYMREYRFFCTIEGYSVYRLIRYGESIHQVAPGLIFSMIRESP